MTIRPAVLGIGELLWDVFPDVRRLGGAPFNVTANLRRLGHPAAFVTAVGDDELGRDAIEAAVDLGIDTTFISVAPDLPTGTVDVHPDAIAGHRFVIGSPAAYDAAGRDVGLASRIEAWGPAALVFGTLAQRSAATLELTRRAVVADRERLYDVNLREGCWTPDLVMQLLSLATIVKVNEAEAEVLGTMLGVPPTPTDLGARLASRFGTWMLCVTRGGAGASLWTDGELVAVEGIQVAVTDTVGAGDAFAAGLLHGRLTGLPAADVLALANRLGAVVASRPGALPDWVVDELR